MPRCNRMRTAFLERPARLLGSTATRRVRKIGVSPAANVWQSALHRPGGFTDVSGRRWQGPRKVGHQFAGVLEGACYRRTLAGAPDLTSVASRQTDGLLEGFHVPEHRAGGDAKRTGEMHMSLSYDSQYRPLNTSQESSDNSSPGVCIP